MGLAYYNEHDPHAAQWLRNLIVEGVIAPGDVDERSIEDVTPNELAGYTQCHFFAGIGVWSYALRRSGWPDDREVWTGSCPCQPFMALDTLDKEPKVRYDWTVQSVKDFARFFNRRLWRNHALSDYMPRKFEKNPFSGLVLA